MTDKNNWQLTAPLDAISFDCDSTLSALEGIDVLAEDNGVGDAVKGLTQQAMNETGLTGSIYEQRMNLVRPNRHQLIELGRQYFEERVPDVVGVIEAFQILKKPVYVISAGLNPSVKLFAALLDIPEERVFAVDVYFNEAGEYASYDEGAPTATKGGKKKVIEKIKQQYPRVMHIGDGMNDVEVCEDVERFVGYGGINYRDKFASLCDYYIKSPSMSPLLPLALTAEELQHLEPQDQALYQQGEGLMHKEVVLNI